MQIRNQYFFSPTNSSTAIRGRNAELIDDSMGLLTAHTADKLKSVIGPATRSEGLTNNTDGITSRHRIAEVTADRVSEEKEYSDYIKKSEFETMEFLKFK